MKKDRNVQTPYPIYPTCQGMGNMPFMPNMMQPMTTNMMQPMMPNMMQQNYLEQNSSMSNDLEQRVTNLEKRVASIETLMNNSNSINNNYNSSNYQML